MKMHSLTHRTLLLPALFFTAALLLPSPPTSAADPGIGKGDIDDALRAGQEKMNLALVLGTWTNSNLKMSMTFSESGDFEFKRGENTVEKGLFKVTPNGDGVIVGVFFSQGKDYFAVTPLSRDRANWAEIKSPTDKPDASKALEWTRSGGSAERATSAPASKNATGDALQTLQTPATLVGKWKGTNADGSATTTSFSESGEFVYDKGGTDGTIKANYTAAPVEGGLLVTLNSDGEKAYYAIAFFSKDRCFQQLLTSPNERIDSNKPGKILTRLP